MFPTYLSALALLFGLFAVVYAFYARAYANDCFLYVSQKNVRSETLKQLTELQTEMTEITDSVVALQKSMTKLRGRIQARTVNESKSNSGEDPEDWKRRTNQQLIGK